MQLHKKFLRIYSTIMYTLFIIFRPRPLISVQKQQQQKQQQQKIDANPIEIYCVEITVKSNAWEGIS